MMFKYEITNAVMGVVHEYMIQNGLIQSHVAKQCGISRSYFNSILNGRRPLNQWVFNQITKGLNIDVHVDIKVLIKKRKTK